MLTHILIATYLLLALASSANAARYPTTRAALRWHPPAWWRAQALCIHRHESADWHRAGRDWQGHPSPYYGGLQFLVSTWRRAGGTGLPSDWTPREQLYRAWIIWRANGGSFREWGTAAGCGLR